MHQFEINMAVHINAEEFVEISEDNVLNSPIAASQRMRNASRVAHAAVERTPVVELLMSPSLSVYDYWQVLDCWLKVWAPLETVVKRTCPAELSPSHMPIMRTRMLRQDLRGVCDVLGEFPKSKVILADSTAAIKDLASLASKRSGWIGLAYVLQGSMLGGAVVASHLQRTLPQNVASCTRFFCPETHSSSDLATQFRLWMQWLDSELIDFSEQQHASFTAVRAFEFLFRSWCPHPSNQ